MKTITTNVNTAASAPSNIPVKRLIAGVLILNLVVAGMIGFSLHQSKRNYDERATVTTQNISQVLDENISGVIAKVDIALQAVSDEAERQLTQGGIREATFNDCIIREHSRLPELAVLRATNASGDALYGAKTIPVKTISLAHRDYYINLRDTPQAGLIISKPLIGGISGKWMIIIARRINQPDGAFAGLVYAGVTLDYLTKSFSNINVGGHGVITLIDSDFSLVARYPEYKKVDGDEALKVESRQFHELIQSGKTSGTYLTKSSIDSIERIFSFRLLALPHPFYIIVGLATSDYLTNWRTEVLMMSLFILLFLVITTVATGLFHREWCRNKEAERAVLIGEQRFRSFVENANDVVFLLSMEGVFTYVSPKWKDAFGYELDDTIGKPFPPFVHPDDVANCFSLLQKVMETGEKQDNIEYRVLRKDGSLIWYSANGSLLHDPENNTVSFLGIGRDISKRKQMEEALRESEAYYHSLFESSLISVAVADRNLVFFNVNDSFSRLLGYSKEELIGTMSLADVSSPYDAEKNMECVKMLMNNEIDHYSLEKRYISKTGNIIPTLIYVSGIYSAEGEFEGITVSVLDISERKKSEEERLLLERQFLHAQKLESLGVMAGGIAHDFNNLLQSILGNMELAARDLDPDSASLNHIANAMNSGKAAAHLTSLMLTYVGKGVITKKKLDLNEMVRANVEMLKTAVSTAVSMELCLAAELPVILADDAQIQQVVMNLITNAAESIDGQMGLVKLTTGVQKCDQAFLDASLLDEKPVPGQYVFLEVSDNGCGMNEETLKRLFDPFFTTKFAGRGLGMSAVMGIIRSHCGALLVESEPGKGTTFRVLFPASESAQQATGPESFIPTPEKGAIREKPFSGVALVVDDEKSVLRVCAKMVTLCGFTVITAGDGIEAVAKFREQADEIVVVLMDSTMPNMDGIEAMNIIYSIKPDIKVILASGFNEEEMGDRISIQSPSGFIRKPYNMNVLETELLRVMQGNSHP